MTLCVSLDVRTTEVNESSDERRRGNRILASIRLHAPVSVSSEVIRHPDQDVSISKSAAAQASPAKDQKGKPRPKNCCAGPSPHV